jgi:hypothetical protein
MKELGGEEVILDLRTRWGEWSASRSGRALASGNIPPVPIVQKASWAPELVWTQRLGEKSFRLCWGSNLDRSIVQPVARHYTDWATAAHFIGTLQITEPLRDDILNRPLWCEMSSAWVSRFAVSWKNWYTWLCNIGYPMQDNLCTLKILKCL